MMQKIIGNCTGHNLKDAKILKSNDFVFTSYAIGKLKDAKILKSNDFVFTSYAIGKLIL
jgi:hypothetical protein